MRRRTTWKWNVQSAAIWWISCFLAFGPLQIVLGNTQYMGSIFGDKPFLYFIFNGLFVATFSTAFVSLIYWIFKKRREKSRITA